MGNHEPMEGEAAVPEGLEHAAAAWERDGREAALKRWLLREVAPEKLPPRLEVAGWWPILERIETARRRRPGAWPIALDALIEPLVRNALRFSRPDGSSVFTAEGPGPGRSGLIHELASRLADPGLQTVAEWWFPRRASRPARRPAPPPLPALALPPLPLALLRADWKDRGDLLAIDQRGDGDGRLELIGAGRRWLGPRWATATRAGAARLVHWTTGPSADVAEWSYRVGSETVTRTAVLLRGRQMALIAEGHSGSDPLRTRSLELSLAPGVTIEPSSPGGAGRLIGPARGTAEVIAPGHDVALGSAGMLRVAGTTGARRSWLPLVVSWDPARTRRGAIWRTLTVTQRTKRCAPDVAVAARVAWGNSRDSLLIYRSLARPALRCFLGHSTTARFLVAVFTTDGEVQPLVSIGGE